MTRYSAKLLLVGLNEDEVMRNTAFIPLTDDLLYEHPERILGPVIPFTQQARRTTVEPAVFVSATPTLDTITKLETTRANSAKRSKRDKASLPQSDSPR